MRSSNSFYVTLFINASREIYENSTHADFNMKHSRPITWEVCVCELLCSSPPPESLNTVDVRPCANYAMINSNIILPQFVGDRTVRCMRMFPTTSFEITSSETSNKCRWSCGSFSLYGTCFSRSRDCTATSRTV